MQVMVYSQHGTFHETGKKDHLSLDGNKALCGFSNCFYASSYGSADVTLEWLSQPGVNEAVCAKCLKIAIKIAGQV